ncbi:hypothetical protein D3C87_1503830 [compost metagenome]
MLHHHDFLRQAELYRRALIKSLNDKHAYGGSKTGDYSWQPEPDFYKSVKDFSYNTPDSEKVLANQLVDLLCLLLWVLLSTAIILFTSKKVRLI